MPQEQSRPHFPAHHVGPLIDQDRQIAIRLNPLGIHGSDNRLAGGPHDQRFFQWSGRSQATRLGIGFQSMVRHHGALFGKAFDVLGLFFQKAHRNEQAENRRSGVQYP